MKTITILIYPAFALFAFAWFGPSPALQASDQPSTCTAPPPGLVGWWPGDGNANDIIGGNNGTLQGDVIFAAGEVDQAFSVDGTTYVDASDSNLPVGDSTATIAAWINTTETGERFFVSWGSRDSCNNGHSIALGTYSDGKLELESCGGAAESAATVTDGEWHHVAAVWYGEDNVTLYVDGLVSTGTHAQPLPPLNIVSSGHVLIGALVQASNSNQFIGLVDELQIFNRPLSADEIAAIYDAGSAGLCKCTADTWASKAPSLQAVAEAGGAVVNGLFYVMDGSGAGGRPAPQVYDPASDSWSNKAADPIMRASAAVGVINNHIYVAEGWIDADSNNPTDALEMYNPANNSWTTKRSSGVRRGATASAVINGKLYVTGGNNRGGTVQFKTLEIYDPVTDTWSVGAPMPVATGGTGTALKRKFYVVGGTFLGADTGILLIYSPATNTWRRGASMPTARSGVSVVALDGKLYAIGGNINGANVSVVEIYDPLSNTWTTGTPESTARFGAAAGVIGSKVYLTGGFDASNVINGSLDVYTAECP